MEKEENLEIKGRLLLWIQAVINSQQSLKNAIAINSKESQEIINSSEYIYGPKYKEFYKKQSKCGTKSEIQINKEYKEIYPKRFPESLDYEFIYTALMEHAIVRFSTIFNAGFGESERVAKNDKNFRDLHLEKIINREFTKESELIKFRALIDSILNARNQMIGHSDGKSFVLEHGSVISKLKMTKTSWDGIDNEYFSEILMKFRLGISSYSRDIIKK